MPVMIQAERHCRTSFIDTSDLEVERRMEQIAIASDWVRTKA